MTSPLGHHTIGHTIIIFCTNDRLWLGVGPVFRHLKLYKPYIIIPQGSVFFVSNNASVQCDFRSSSQQLCPACCDCTSIAQNPPASNGCAWRTAATRLLPFLSQRLEVNRWNPYVQNTWAEFVQLDGKRISEMFEVLWTWTCQFFPVGNVGTRFEGIDLLPEIFSAACASLVDWRFLF